MHSRVALALAFIVAAATLAVALPGCSGTADGAGAAPEPDSGTDSATPVPTPSTSATTAPDAAPEPTGTTFPPAEGAGTWATVDPTVAGLLPSPVHIDKLFDHLGSLDEKVKELDEVLARDELDLGKATRALREAEAEGGPAQRHAESVLASVRRLLSLRDKARRERDELLSLSRRLRLAVTVLRFSGGAEEDVGGIVAEIVGRVEGVREAFAEG